MWHLAWTLALGPHSEMLLLSDKPGTVRTAQDDPELTETFLLLNAVIVNVCTVPSSRRMT